MKTAQLITLLLFASISLDAQEPRTINTKPVSQNAEVKKELLEMNQSLQQDFATMESLILNLSKLNDELESITNDYSERLVNLIESNITSERSVSDLKAVLAEITKMNWTFMIQYLALQQKMQSDNRQFTSLSNIMKTKHDSAKNAINNVR